MPAGPASGASAFTSRFLATEFQGIAKLLLSLKPVVLVKPVGASPLHIYLIGAFANLRFGNLSILCRLCTVIFYLASMWTFEFIYPCCGLFFMISALQSTPKFLGLHPSVSKLSASAALDLTVPNSPVVVQKGAPAPKRAGGGQCHRRHAARLLPEPGGRIRSTHRSIR
jgi:hypothetical protein